MIRALLLITLASLAAPRSLSAAEGFPWVVSAARAKTLLAQGAILLDVRVLPPVPHRIRGALVVDWRAYSKRGALLPPKEVARRLRALGITTKRPVLVFGDPLKQWGEDGRIVWMLRTVGHPRAALVDGGVAALRAAGVSSAKRPAISGDLKPRPRTRWTITTPDLKRAMDERRGALVLVDTREQREFAGATPYGEKRGGHLPGAVHLYYKDLLDERGRLRPAVQLRALLGKRGIVPAKEIIAYCTGGVRSAWFAVALLHLGYPRVRNYAASTWAWAAGPADAFPLRR